MTYLYWKKIGKLEWTARVEAKGYMWASPGEYLRKSMLVSLTRKVSDLYLPEAFYKTYTFDESPRCATRPPDEEDALSSALALRINMEYDSVKDKHKDEDKGVDMDMDADTDVQYIKTSKD